MRPPWGYRVRVVTGSAHAVRELGGGAKTLNSRFGSKSVDGCSDGWGATQRSSCTCAGAPGSKESMVPKVDAWDGARAEIFAF